MSHTPRWTDEERDQMRQRMVEEVAGLRDSAQACKVLQQIAHRGPAQAVMDCMQTGSGPIVAHSIVGSVCRAACDIVLTQLVEADPPGMDYKLTEQALVEQLSDHRASVRKSKEDPANAGMLKSNK